MVMAGVITIGEVVSKLESFIGVKVNIVGESPYVLKIVGKEMDALDVKHLEDIVGAKVYWKAQKDGFVVVIANLG